MSSSEDMGQVTVAPLPPTVSPFTFIHKSIRLILVDTLIELGKTDYRNWDCAQRIVPAVEDALDYCEQHLQHEEQFLRPACAGRVSLAVFDTGHPAQEMLVSELRAVLTALRSAQPSQTPRLGMALYLKFAAFVAECLAHMTDEEQLLAPALLHEFSEDELEALEAQIVQSMAPEEAARGFALMLIASSRSERRELLAKLVQHAPRAHVLDLLEQVRPRLTQDDYSDLAARMGHESSAA